jgi:hypothetical protein
MSAPSHDQYAGGRLVPARDQCGRGHVPGIEPCTHCDTDPTFATMGYNTDDGKQYQKRSLACTDRGAWYIMGQHWSEEQDALRRSMLAAGGSPEMKKDGLRVNFTISQVIIRKVTKEVKRQGLRTDQPDYKQLRMAVLETTMRAHAADRGIVLPESVVDCTADCKCDSSACSRWWCSKQYEIAQRNPLTTKKRSTS